MARGVSKRFIRILEDEQRGARGRIAVLGILGVLLFAPAFLLAPPVGAMVHAAALILGFLVGLLWAWRTYSRTYQDGLVALWSQWMHAANGSQSLAECHRKVMGRSGRNLTWLYAILLALFWVGEVGLMVLALAGTAVPFAWGPVIAINAFVIGAVVAHSMRGARWSRQLQSAAQEMIDEGQIGVWGTQ